MAAFSEYERGAFAFCIQMTPSGERAVCAGVFERDVSLSETVSRAAQPRRNPRVFVAVRRFAADGSPVARLLLFAS